jgi:DNA-binding MarR family transcriptional regulator
VNFGFISLLKKNRDINKTGGVVMDIKEAVLKVLEESPEPMRPGDIAQKAGLDKKEVDKAIKDLKKEEKIISPKRCFYSKA